LILEIRELIARPWNLVADIGGTNARFGLQDRSTRELSDVCCYSVADYRNFSTALTRFLSRIAENGGWQPCPQAACLAVASVVEADVIQLTNSPWQIDRKDVCAILGNADIELINDFLAVGFGVLDLRPTEWRQIGRGEPAVDRPVAVLGPGTGLGVCSVVPTNGGYLVIGGEGGHVDFAPVDEDEIAVLRILTKRFGRVSAERLLSGGGIQNIYRALVALSSESAAKPAVQEVGLKTASDITEAALKAMDVFAVRTLEMFCRILGSVAGNLALTLGAQGGVYIAGGIVPRVVEFLEGSGFRRRFESKGRFTRYMEEIPLRVVVKENLGLYGAIKKMNLSES